MLICPSCPSTNFIAQAVFELPSVAQTGILALGPPASISRVPGITGPCHHDYFGIFLIHEIRTFVLYYHIEKKNPGKRGSRPQREVRTTGPCLDSQRSVPSGTLHQPADADLDGRLLHWACGHMYIAWSDPTHLARALRSRSCPQGSLINKHGHLWTVQSFVSLKTCLDPYHPCPKHSTFKALSNKLLP